MFIHASQNVERHVNSMITHCCVAHLHCPINTLGVCSWPRLCCCCTRVQGPGYASCRKCLDHKIGHKELRILLADKTDPVYIYFNFAFGCCQDLSIKLLTPKGLLPTTTAILVLCDCWQVESHAELLYHVNITLAIRQCNNRQRIQGTWILIRRANACFICNSTIIKTPFTIHSLHVLQ